MSPLNGAIATNGWGRWLGVMGVVPWRAQAWTTGSMTGSFTPACTGTWASVWLMAGRVGLNHPLRVGMTKVRLFADYRLGLMSRRAACLRRKNRSCRTIRVAAEDEVCREVGICGKAGWVAGSRPAMTMERGLNKRRARPL